MLGINLVVPIALDDFSSTLSGLLGTLSKTIKSHHNGNPINDAETRGLIITSLF
jgi:hypothetical protein